MGGRVRGRRPNAAGLARDRRPEAVVICGTRGDMQRGAVAPMAIAMVMGGTKQ